jgi:membrane protein required for colicin V production
MNWLDIVLAAIIGISVAAGVYKGFFRLAIGLTTSVLAILLSCWFYGTAAGLYSPYLKEERLANLLGFLTILISVQLTGMLIATLLARATKKAGLGWLDRALGALFGVVRAVLISSVIVMVMTAFAVKPPPASVADSGLAPYVMEGARILVYLTPREIRDGFHDGYEKLKKKWNQTIDETVKQTPKVFSQ